MVHLNICKPTTKNIEELHRLLITTITDTFKKNGIGDDVGLLNNEIEEKKQFVYTTLASVHKETFLLTAIHQKKIVGVIGYGPSSELINKCTHDAYSYLGEIGTVFVLPEYQGKGVGSQLLGAMFAVLKERDVHEFYLDSGYPSAQKIWIKKFGNADYIVKDHWGEGLDHMIWRRSID